MLGLVGKKIGMTSIYDTEGKNVACTVLEAGPCVVTQIRTVEKDGYSAVQLGYDDKKEKKTSSALKGHFKKAKTSPKRKVVEIRDFDNDVNLGDSVNLELFQVGEFIDVVGTSKGKGFQGVVKRHGFSGVGGQTHGQHNRGRAPGSLGAASTPSRVFKGIRMAGRMGGARVKLQNLEVLKLDIEKNLVVVRGAVPGARGSYVILEK